MHDRDRRSVAIRSYIVKQFPVARKESLKDDTQLLTSGIVDSLGMLDLVRFLEESYMIQISDEELTPENFASIACLASFVESKGHQVGALAK
jgi:acyl carrier protein